VTLAAIAGLTIPMVDGPLLAILQAIVAPDLQGRVFTLLGSLSKGMAPLSLLIAGPIGLFILLLAASSERSHPRKGSGG
jgi:DHA3 family macrolide efflux protein-like MFS transporter